MSLHQFDFTYTVREYGNIDMDLDTKLTEEEAHALAMEEIMQEFPDIENVEITGMSKI